MDAVELLLEELLAFTDCVTELFLKLRQPQFQNLDKIHCVPDFHPAAFHSPDSTEEFCDLRSIFEKIDVIPQKPDRSIDPPAIGSLVKFRKSNRVDSHRRCLLKPEPNQDPLSRLCRKTTKSQKIICKTIRIEIL
jgi:hypothetical protein